MPHRVHPCDPIVRPIAFTRTTHHMHLYALDIQHGPNAGGSHYVCTCLLRAAAIWQSLAGSCLLWQRRPSIPNASFRRVCPAWMMSTRPATGFRCESVLRRIEGASFFCAIPLCHPNAINPQVPRCYRRCQFSLQLVGRILIVVMFLTMLKFDNALRIAMEIVGLGMVPCSAL